MSHQHPICRPDVVDFLNARDLCRFESAHARALNLRTRRGFAQSSTRRRNAGGSELQARSARVRRVADRCQAYVQNLPLGRGRFEKTPPRTPRHRRRLTRRQLLAKRRLLTNPRWTIQSAAPRWSTSSTLEASARSKPRAPAPQNRDAANRLSAARDDPRRAANRRSPRRVAARRSSAAPGGPSPRRSTRGRSTSRPNAAGEAG